MYLSKPAHKHQLEIIQDKPRYFCHNLSYSSKPTIALFLVISTHLVKWTMQIAFLLYYKFQNCYLFCFFYFQIIAATSYIFFHFFYSLELDKLPTDWIKIFVLFLWFIVLSFYFWYPGSTHLYMKTKKHITYIFTIYNFKDANYKSRTWIKMLYLKKICLLLFVEIFLLLHANDGLVYLLPTCSHRAYFSSGTTSSLWQEAPSNQCLHYFLIRNLSNSFITPIPKTKN